MMALQGLVRPLGGTPSASKHSREIRQIAARFLTYKRRSRARWARWFFGMNTGSTVDPDFDDVDTADLMTGGPIWYDDTSVCLKSNHYYGSVSPDVDRRLKELDAPIMKEWGRQYRLEVKQRQWSRQEQMMW